MSDVAVNFQRPKGMNECLKLGNGTAGPNACNWVDALTDYERRLALRFAFIRSERAST